MLLTTAMLLSAEYQLISEAAALSATRMPFFLMVMLFTRASCPAQTVMFLFFTIMAVVRSWAAAFISTSMDVESPFLSVAVIR